MPPDPNALRARTCPACEVRDVRALGAKNDYPLAACRRCGTIFVPMEPPAEALDALYRDYCYRPTTTIPPWIQDQLRRVVASFAPHRGGGRLLEVGCGAGGLLAAAREAGWEARGVERSEAAVSLARSSGLDVDAADFLAYQPPVPFDVVVMIELLEHVVRPAAFLRKARACLKPGGLLYVTTPNGDALSRHLLGLDWTPICPPEHLQLYTAAGLAGSMRGAGFTRARVWSGGFNVAAARDRFLPRPVGSPAADAGQQAFDLNRRLTASPLRRAVKAALNVPFRLSGLGDGLKATAVAGG